MIRGRALRCLTNLADVFHLKCLKEAALPTNMGITNYWNY